MWTDFNNSFTFGFVDKLPRCILSRILWPKNVAWLLYATQNHVQRKFRQ